MSRPGDVVWADGRSWVRRHNSFGGVKMWWMSEGSDAWGWHTLAYLRTLDDFAWLVRDGKRQHSYPGDVAMLRERVSRQKEAIQSYQETVRELAANVVALTAERDAARTDLDEMTKARDAAAKGYLAKIGELEDVHAELFGWSCRKVDEFGPSQAEQVRKLRDAWRDVAKERDQALRELADLQRLVAAAEANELVLVHPDWRQAEIDELAEERDQLSQELAQVKWFREQTQRRRDHLSNAHQELRRQFDVAVNDRNILRARCDELERGDRHSYGFKCGQQEERRAVVAWLNKDPQGWARQWSLAGRIERGEHDV